MDTNSIKLITNGQTHVLSVNEHDVWSSNYFDADVSTIRHLMLLSDEHFVQEPVYNVFDSTEIRIRFLETVLTYGLIDTKQQLRDLNRIMGLDCFIDVLLVRVFKLFGIDTVTRYHGADLAALTIARLYFLTSSQTEFYKNSGGYPHFINPVKILAKFGLLRDQSFPLLLDLSNVQPVFQFDKFHRSSISGKQIASIMTHINDTFCRILYGKVWGYSCHIDEIVWAQWADYSLMYSWYEWGCWQGGSKEVLPVFLECFDESQIHLRYPSNISDCLPFFACKIPPYYLHSQLDHVTAFTVHMMLRALYFENCIEPYPGRLDGNTPKDIFPSSEEIIDTAPRNSSTRGRLLHALKISEPTFNFIKNKLPHQGSNK